MTHRDQPLPGRAAPRRWRWPAVLPVVGALAVAGTLWPVAGAHAAATRREATASVAARVVSKPLPAWELRAVTALPPRLRERATAILQGRPGSSGCITGPGQAAQGQAWLAGFANVAKLHGAALVGPAFADVVIVTKEIICQKFVTELSTEVPSFHGKPEFPPTRATFLAFGFVPVSATVQISQVGVGTISLTLATGVAAVAPYIVQAKARVNIKVLNARVDGVALPTGPNCGTATPGTATLGNVNPTGEPGPNFWDLFTGGPLSGTVEVTHFSRCGVNGDNLDSILDASISGAQNFTKLIQGVPCVFDNLESTSCPPQVPAPRR